MKKFSLESTIVLGAPIAVFLGILFFGITIADHGNQTMFQIIKGLFTGYCF